MKMPDETKLSEDDGWLNSRLFECSHCGYSLWRLDHSPFYNSWYVYCDSCPCCVEVRVWDDVVLQARQRLSNDNRGQFWPEIEQKLKPCSCGGSYRFSSPRRCFNCNGVVIEANDARGVDIYPGHLDIRDIEPTQLQEEQYYQFEAKFGCKSEDIWKESN